MRKDLINRCYQAVVLMISMLSLFACQKEHMTLTTTSDVNITGYFEKNQENFSLFSEMLDRSKTSGYLGAYGTYTVFAPTNAGVKSWLDRKGVSSLSQLSDAEIYDVVKFHLIKDTLSTVNFTDGKLRTKTFYGQYLLMGASNVNGVSKYTVQKQANIEATNIRVGNGIIHIIDNVLEPAKKTIAQLISENPRYSIFSEALTATKLYDTLNTIDSDTSKLFKTVVALSDAAFNKENIFSYSDLAAKLSKTGNPALKTDSLWLFMAYHIMAGANFLADFSISSSFDTFVDNEVITVSLNGQDILINDLEFNGEREVGAKLNRAHGDVPAANGVIQESESFYKIKVRVPVPVYFDVADQPEIKSVGSVYRVAGKNMTIGANSVNSLCAGITYGNATATQNTTYTCFSATEASTYAAGNDILQFAIGTTSARQLWIQFKTPFLVKGAYKVWVCHRPQSSKYPYIQATIDAGTPDEQVLSNILNVGTYLNGYGVNLSASNSNDLLYAAGVKRYSYEQPATNSNTLGRYMGTVVINSSAKHTIRLTRVGGTGDQTPNFWVDMIHFIPVDMDQYHMRFDKTGAIKYVD